MRALGGGLVVLGIFLAANVVAAGVILILGRILLELGPDWESPWPWFVVGTAGVLAALLFTRGALSSVPRWFR